MSSGRARPSTVAVMATVRPGMSFGVFLALVRMPLAWIGAGLDGRLSKLSMLGGYLVLYPRVRVRTYFPPVFLFHVPAWVVLIFWFGEQALTGLGQQPPEGVEVHRRIVSHRPGPTPGAVLALSRSEC